MPALLEHANAIFNQGNSFNLTITVHTSPLMVTVYTKCIKVAINEDCGH